MTPLIPTVAARPRPLAWLALVALVAVALARAPAVAGAEAELRLLVFGDSLSAAYGMAEEQGWVSLLADRLRETGYRAEVVNASVSGETTTGGRARLPAALDYHQPHILILELGGNDGLRGLPVAALRDNLAAMIELAQAAGAEVLLVGTRIPPNYGPRYTEPFFATYGELAADYDLPLVPFLIDGIAQRPELMQQDGIHPRAEAQGLILDKLWPQLEPMLRTRLAGGNGAG